MWGVLGEGGMVAIVDYSAKYLVLKLPNRAVLLPPPHLPSSIFIYIKLFNLRAYVVIDK